MTAGRILGLVLACAACAPAQEPGTPLEELLEKVDARLLEMREQFDGRLNEALRIFRSPLPSHRVMARQYVQDLVPWVGVFPKRFAELAVKEKSDRARLHVFDVMSRSEEPRVAPYLATLLDSQELAGKDLLRAQIVRCLGHLNNRRLAGRLRQMLAADPPKVLRPALLVTLARLGHEDALGLARAALRDETTGVRLAALEAIGALGDGSRETAALLLETARKEKDEKVRAETIRVMRGFNGHYEILKFVHKALESTQRDTLSAALEALRVIGRKDLSKPPLMAMIGRRKQIPSDLRDRAARLLLQWGVMSGVRAVVKPLKDLADRDPRNSNLQRDVAERYRGLGAWREAITHYKAALRNARGGRVRLYQGLARCYARLGKFKNARRELQNAGYSDFSMFKDDADFATMRAHRDYTSLFEPKR